MPGMSPTRRRPTFAVQHYETALAQFQSYRGDALATLDAALAADPSFVSAHLFKAFVLYTLTEREVSWPMPRPRSTPRARVRAAMTPRERFAARSGRPAAPLRVGRRLPHVRRGAGRSPARRPRAADRAPDGLLPRRRAEPAQPDRARAAALERQRAGLFVTCSACTRSDSRSATSTREAERTARRALEIEPKDGWAVHAVAHVMEMQGRIDEGVAWLQSREQDWAPDNGFAFHNWWHLALFHLDRGDIDRVLDLYDTAVHPEPAVFALALVDATALLWRLALEGVDVGDRWDERGVELGAATRRRAWPLRVQRPARDAGLRGSGPHRGRRPPAARAAGGRPRRRGRAPA